jgi:hypothetical protein
LVSQGAKNLGVVSVSRKDLQAMRDAEEQVGLRDEPERFGAVGKIGGLAWQICFVDVVRTLVVVGMHSAEMEGTRCLERVKSLAVVVVVIDHSNLEQHLAKVVQAGMTLVARC